MSEQEKLDKIADVLDAEAGMLSIDMRLDEMGWDSMGMLSVIALAKANGKIITGAQIRTFETVGDVLNSAF